MVTGSANPGDIAVRDGRADRGNITVSSQTTYAVCGGANASSRFASIVWEAEHMLGTRQNLTDFARSPLIYIRMGSVGQKDCCTQMVKQKWPSLVVMACLLPWLAKVGTTADAGWFHGVRTVCVSVIALQDTDVFMAFFPALPIAPQGGAKGRAG